MNRLIIFLLFFVPLWASAQGTCLSVDGLKFEAIDYSKLLVIKSDKNIAIMSIATGGVDLRKESTLAFRFFTPTVCINQNDKFHLNGKLVEITNIQLLKY
jgi:hypothetical protein